MSARVAVRRGLGPLVIGFTLAVAATSVAVARPMPATPVLRLPFAEEGVHLNAPGAKPAADPAGSSGQPLPIRVEPAGPPHPSDMNSPAASDPPLISRPEPIPISGTPGVEAHAPGVLDRLKVRVYDPDPAPVGTTVDGGS